MFIFPSHAVSKPRFFAFYTSIVGTGEFFLNAQRIIILPSLERAKKSEFNSISCVTLAYSIPEIHILKVTTSLVQWLMRNRNKNCDGCVITRRNPEILISSIAHK